MHVSIPGVLLIRTMFDQTTEQAENLFTCTSICTQLNN